MTCLVALTGCQNQQSARTSVIDSRASYAAGVPTQGLCAGLPRVRVKAQAASVKCVALIDDQLQFPRGVVSLGNQLLVVDKGSNLFSAQRGINTGQVLAYQKIDTRDNASGPIFKKRLLIDKLDHPNGISAWLQGSTRYVFVSTPEKVWRFNPDAAIPGATLEAVISNLPTHGWHYLTQVHIHANTLYVAIPSATDHCEDGHPGAITVQYPCIENALTRADNRKTATVRAYKIRPDGSLEPDFSLVALGLRDAMAITTDPETKRIWLADNAWDQIDLQRFDASAIAGSDGAHDPQDELNLLTPQAHYGWPYCHSDNRLTPLYAASGVSCEQFQAPELLLPAHAAPLGMTYRSQQLFINLHGFQPAGRKTVYFNLDSNRLPTGSARTLIDWNYAHEPGYFFGRPFGITQHGPARLAITDDWNHALMVVEFN